MSGCVRCGRFVGKASHCAPGKGCDGTVSVVPLRDRFVSMRDEGEVTAQGVARELGWFRRPSPRMLYVTEPQPDGTRVRRTLGVASQRSKGRPMYRQLIGYDLAERLCRALNLDPFEAGL